MRVLHAVMAALVADVVLLALFVGLAWVLHHG